MRRRTFLSGAAAVGAAALATSRAASQDDGALVGEWGGVLLAGAQRLRLRFVIAHNQTGGLTVTAYSLDQGSPAIPGADARLQGDRFTVAFPSINGRYQGRLAGPDRMEGEWRQGGRMPLDLERDPDFEAMQTAAAPLTEERLATLRDRAGSPALAAAAIGPGGRAAFATGRRQSGRPQMVTTEDRWHIGSITKSFTATLVARLVAAGVVAWDDTPARWLGESVPDRNPAYGGATFRHLLSHRAGLQANIPVADLLAFPRFEDDARASRRAYCRLALAAEPSGPLGESFTYSNDGYVVAGAMLEAATGQPWEELAREHVFAPLGLSSAGFGPPGEPGELDEPVGHALGVIAQLGIGSGRRAYPPTQDITDNPAVLGPAGRIHIAFDDLLRYLAAHRDREPFLATTHWDALHAPPFGGDYALGWTVRADGSLWHNGSNTLWYAEALFDRGSGVVACAAANDGATAFAAPAVGEALAGAAAAVS